MPPKAPAKKDSKFKATITWDPTQVICLVSNDGREFFVDKRCAIISSVLKERVAEEELKQQLQPNEKLRIEVNEANAQKLEKVRDYFIWLSNLLLMITGAIFKGNWVHVLQDTLWSRFG